MMNRRPVRYLPALFIFLCSLLCCAPAGGSARAETPARRMTVMVYMCGSNLESAYGSASADLSEMAAADNDPAELSVLVMAGGSRMNPKSAGYFHSDRTTIYEVGKGRIRGVWDSTEPMSMGEAETLETLICYARENRPAKKYALILWDHGGGPLEGVCWDELFSMEQLALKELVRALDKSQAEEKLSWIGFDACLMGCAEVAGAVSPYAEYMIASQEKEPAAGWDYGFLKDLLADADGAGTGKRIVDAYMELERTTPNPLTLSCVDLRKMRDVLPAMDTFFANVGAGITPETYGELSVQRMDSVCFGEAMRGAETQAYDLIDLQDLVRKLGKNGNEQRLLSLLQEAVVYSRSTIPGAAGLSVYHPFSNKKDYLDKWSRDYAELEFCEKYQSYVSRFAGILTSDVLTDWSGLQPETEAAGPAGEQIFTLQLTEAQRMTCAKGQLLILAAYDQVNGVYAVPGARSDDPDIQYLPVSVSSAKISADGRVTAALDTRTLYATDESGKPLCGPLTWELSDDGQTLYVEAGYFDESGREDTAADLRVLFSFALDESGGALRKTGVMGYDPATRSYTPRVPVREEDYTLLRFTADAKKMPTDQDRMPGFEEWEDSEWLTELSVELPEAWELRFFDTPMSAVQLCAVFQLRDNQHTTHSSRPVTIDNPNLEAVRLDPRVTENSHYRLRLFLLRDASPLDPGVNLAVEVTNLSEWISTYWLTSAVINGTQSILSKSSNLLFFNDVPPRATRTKVVHLDGISLANLSRIDELSLDFARSSEKETYVEDTLRLAVGQCDLTGIAQQKDTVLARTETEGLTWELLGLDRTRGGGFSALLRVTNPTDRDVVLNAKGAVNDILVDDILGNSIYTVIPARSMGCLTAELPDRCTLTHPFHVDGDLRNNTLTAENQWEQHGVTEIRSLRLVPLTAIESRGVTLTPDTPVPLEKPAGEAPAGRPLLTGQVEAYAERIFLADNGIGIRAVFVNPTDQDVYVQYEQAAFNGQYLESFENYYLPSFTVPAGGKTVRCMGFTNRDFEKRGERIEEFRLTFRIGQDVSTECVLHLRLPEDGSRYLPEDCFEIIPGEYEPLTLNFLNGRFEEERHFAVEVEGAFIRFGGDYYVFAETADRDDDSALLISAKLTNLTDETRLFQSTNLTVNGTRVTNQSWFAYSLAPGETTVMDHYIPVSQLQGLTEIREISCSVSSRPREDPKASLSNPVPLSFPVEPLDISALVPAIPEPLARGENDAVSVQLLELSEDETGLLTLQLRFTGRNPEGYAFRQPAVLLDGFVFKEESRVYGNLPILSAGQDYIFKRTSKNQAAVPKMYVDAIREDTGISGENTDYVLEDHALERRGLGAVSEIRLIEKADADRRTFEDIVLRPESPVPLTDIPAVPDDGRLRILASPAEVLINEVLIGENNVYLSLDMINGTDRTIYLYAESPFVNGEACGSHLQGTDPLYILPARTRTTEFLMLKRDPETSLQKAGDLIQDFTVVWDADRFGESAEHSMPVTVTLLREAPLGVKEGLILTGNDLGLDVSKAELLLKENPAMAAETASPVRLIPALDEKRTEAFVSGTAVVCLRNEGAYWGLTDKENADGYYEHRTLLQPLCMTQLARGTDGGIMSKYSGLACVNSRGQALMIQEYSDLNEAMFGAFLEASGESSPPAAFSALFADTYLSRDAFLSARAENPDVWPQPDCQLFAYFALDLMEKQPAVPWSYRQLLTNDFGSELTLTKDESSRMLCVMNRQLIVPDDSGQDRLIYGPLQIARLGDLRFIRADGLEGTLTVRYELTYEDGSVEVFYEAYPSGS